MNGILKIKTPRHCLGVIGLLMGLSLLFQGRVEAAQNELLPFHDTIDVFVTSTPSNILSAWENPIKAGDTLTQTQGQITLTGVSQTTPSFMMTADIDFSKNKWSIANIQFAGTVPPGHLQPELITEDVAVLSGTPAEAHLFDISASWAGRLIREGCNIGS